MPVRLLLSLQGGGSRRSNLTIARYSWMPLRLLLSLRGGGSRRSNLTIARYSWDAGETASVFARRRQPTKQSHNCAILLDATETPSVFARRRQPTKQSH